MNEGKIDLHTHLARRFNLVITGVSDEHGWPTGFPYLGSQPVTSEIFLHLANKAGARV